MVGMGLVLDWIGLDWIGFSVSVKVVAAGLAAVMVFLI